MVEQFESKTAKSEDTQSLTSQRSNTLSAIKSYANILSGGLKKVGSVFKSKQQKEIKKEQTYKETSHNEIEIHKEVASVESNFMPALQLISDEVGSKPPIPGLLFRDLERRPSKKKRKSRSTSMIVENNNPANHQEDNSRNKSTTSLDVLDVSESEERLRSKILDVMSFKKDVQVIEEQAVSTNDNKSIESSLKRKNSKKKRIEPTPKFEDEIDQALHEINILESQDKLKTSNSNSLKRRFSKKRRSKAFTEIKS